MKITARKCPWTKRLFEADSDYLVHLQNVRENLRTNRDVNRSVVEADLAFRWAEQNVCNAEEFEQWIRDNWTTLIHRTYHIERKRWGSKKKIKIKPMTLLDVEVVQLSGDIGVIGNSHSCPKNGVRNWERKTDLPLAYPGWMFRLSVKYDGDFPGFFSDLFRESTIHLGAGSGGRTNYSTEVALWADDWPAMKDYMEKKRVWDVLSN